MNLQYVQAKGFAWLNGQFDETLRLPLTTESEAEGDGFIAMDPDTKLPMYKANDVWKPIGVGTGGGTLYDVDL